MSSTNAQWRNLAISMLKQGKAPAEVWETLTSNGMDRNDAEALVRELLELRRQAEAASAPAANVYAPPVVPVAQQLGWDEADRGNWMKGLVAGLFCGCWAVLAALLLGGRTMGSETKKGIYIGTVINIFIGAICALARKL